MNTAPTDPRRPQDSARALPRDSALDSTLALVADPYRFIATRCAQFGEDLFLARIMLRKTICMSGPRAAALFYDTERFLRHGAAPLRLQKTLFGRGGVQGLDDAEHRHRKQVFMALMTPESISRLGELSAQHWMNHAREWTTTAGNINLYQEARTVLCRSVCQWAGVPLQPAEIQLRTGQLSALFESAGAVGPRHWQGRRARAKAEDWICDLIAQIRRGERPVANTSAAAVIASHRDLQGNLLDTRIAAVELLNVLRPTVAVAVYIVLCAHALHQHPHCRDPLRDAGNTQYAESFVQEVRRYYPFFPAVMARARRAFDWNGFHFPAGRRVLLDLYGTNHDPRVWQEPGEFRPDRFIGNAPGEFDLIPQGGGGHYLGHRCPGEWIALELMKRAARFFTSAIRYDLPQQDLRIDFTRLPALPHSQFLISGVSLV